MRRGSKSPHPRRDYAASGTHSSPFLIVHGNGKNVFSGFDIESSIMPSSKKLKVVVTGTTGKLGSSVFKHLLTLISRSSIIVSLYNPSKKPDGADGIEIREGNYEDPASLDRAYKDADILFLMSYPSIRYQVRVDVSVILYLLIICIDNHFHPLKGPYECYRSC